MRTFYAVGAILATAALLYCTGWAGGTATMREKCTRNATQITLAQTQHAIQTNRKINAETYNTTTRDIRRILRATYTIAE